MSGRYVFMSASERNTSGNRAISPPSIPIQTTIA